MAEIADSFPQDDALPQPKRKSLSIGIIGAIVAAITILECAAIYIYLVGGYSRGKAEVHRAVATEEHVQLRDVDLGRFSLTAVDPKSNGPLLIEFHLVGSLAATHSENEAGAAPERDEFNRQAIKPSNATDVDATAFERQFGQERNRFRDQVIVIIGNAQISALSDPNFGEIKREILARANSLLGEPPLKDIRFSDFAVLQQ